MFGLLCFLLWFFFPCLFFFFLNSHTCVCGKGCATESLPSPFTLISLPALGRRSQVQVQLMKASFRCTACSMSRQHKLPYRCPHPASQCPLPSPLILSSSKSSSRRDTRKKENFFVANNETKRSQFK